MKRAMKFVVWNISGAGFVNEWPRLIKEARYGYVVVLSRYGCLSHLMALFYLGHLF